MAEPDLHNLKSRRALIYADEPPCLHAVNALAFNAALAAHGRPKGQFFKVGWIATRLRHLLAYTASKFKTYDEIAAEKGLVAT